MKIALIGSDGQLGFDLSRVIPADELIPLTENDIDITDFDLTSKVLKKHKPDIVINTAAYNKVDDAEDNDLLAFKINALGAKNVAIVCRDINAALVHISTDYVFSGENRSTPYKETDCPSPRTAYGISKLAGERYVSYILNKYYIIRTCGLFGIAGCKGKGGGNFVETMLKLAKESKEIKVVDDQIISPTYAKDLAEKIYELIGMEKFGLYHITNSGSCSWYDFAKKIFELSKIDAKIERLKTDQSNARAIRPHYSVLQGSLSMRAWSEAVEDYLAER